MIELRWKKVEPPVSSNAVHISGLTRWAILQYREVFTQVSAGAKHVTETTATEWQDVPID